MQVLFSWHTSIIELFIEILNNLKIIKILIIKYRQFK